LIFDLGRKCENFKSGQLTGDLGFLPQPPTPVGTRTSNATFTSWTTVHLSQGEPQVTTNWAVQTHLQQRFKSVYYPGWDIAVDEAMVKFQGRSTMKQYMPLKPIKRGFKVWMLGDSSTGYFSRLDVYTGKKDTGTKGRLGATVVKTLTSNFQHRWHRCFFDNFFTSKTLLCELLEVGIFGIGTCRKDRRHFPDALKGKLRLTERQENREELILDSLLTFLHSPRGDSISMQSGEVVATAWKDNKVVMSMYTGYSPAEKVAAHQTGRTGENITVQCPAAIAQYNQYMQGCRFGAMGPKVAPTGG